MSITAIVENDTIKLSVHVPDGTKVEITLPEKQASSVVRAGRRPDFLARQRALFGERVLQDSQAALDELGADRFDTISRP